MSRTLPRPTALSQPYWDGCREGSLRLQRCEDCAEFQFYPRVICSHCGGGKLAWHASSGKGRVASFTVVQRGISAAYPVPYVVALIDLEEGTRMMSNLIDVPQQGVQIGDRVEVTFVNWSDAISMPVFRPIKQFTGESK